MGGINYYDREGRPISMPEWGQRLGDREYARVAETTVGGWWVSTVWLGLDHRWGEGGAPLIFETMVFAKDDDRVNLDEELCDRYSTEADALAGHEAIVRLVQLSVEQAQR